MERYKRISGDDRVKLQAELVRKYADGATMRALAEEIGRSYGFVQRLIRESGTPIHQRGGSTKVDA